MDAKDLLGKLAAKVDEWGTSPDELEGLRIELRDALLLLKRAELRESVKTSLAMKEVFGHVMMASQNWLGAIRGNQQCARVVRASLTFALREIRELR